MCILWDTEAGFLLCHKTSLPFTPDFAPMLPKKQSATAICLCFREDLWLQKQLEGNQFVLLLQSDMNQLERPRGASVLRESEQARAC